MATVPAVFDPDVVDVWLVPAVAANRLHRLLTHDEQQRAARFATDRARQTWIAARGGLRLILSRALECEPASVTVAVEDSGKPFVSGRPVEFNVSHSGEVAAVAVTRAGRCVGIDVEERRPVQHERRVAERIMTADELSRYASLQGDERGAFVLWVWARKEALVKATGEGMAAVLGGLACEPPASDPFAVIDIQVPGYAAAVAGAGHDWSPVVRELDLHEKEITGASDASRRNRRSLGLPGPG